MQHSITEFLIIIVNSYAELNLPLGDFNKFWEKFKRRNMLRVALTYFVVTWLLVQIGDIVFPALKLPDWTITFLIVLLLFLFPIALLMAWAYEMSPDGLIKTGSSEAKENSFSTQQKKPFTSYTILIVLAVLAIILAIYSITGISAIKAKSGEVSIAIIPFRNNTGLKEQRHLGLGFANSVRSQLSQSKQFDFISALAATTKYWNQDTSPNQIGNELKVDYLLTGMYQTSGGNIQINVELVNASSGEGVWDVVLNEKFKDLFNIQSKIAQMVLDEFSLESSNTTSNYTTTNIESYGHYLKGLEYQTQPFDTANLWNMYYHFSQAVNLDSTYMEAWLAMILSKSSVAFQTRNTNKEYSLLIAREVKGLVEKFAYLFPSAWELNLARGFYLYRGLRELDKALEYFEKALEYDEENYYAQLYAGIISKRKLQVEKSLQHLSKAIELQPNMGVLWLEIGFVFKVQGDYKLALKAFDNAKYLGVDTEAFKRLTFYQLGKSYLPDSLNYPHQFWRTTHLYNRDYHAIINLYDTAVDFRKEEFRHKSHAYYLLDEIDSAIKYSSLIDVSNDWIYKSYQLAQLNSDIAIDPILREISLNEKEGDLYSMCRKNIILIEIQAMLGQYEKATETLKKMNEDYPEYSNYSYIKTAPEFDKIKAEYPPFTVALKNLKSPPPIEVDKIIKF